jgi:hypothetical protein
MYRFLFSFFLLVCLFCVWRAEKHVGVATDDIQLNAYSATPEQLRAWVAAWQETRASCGNAVYGAAAAADKKIS